MRQLLADNQGLLNRIFDIVFDVGAGDNDGDDGVGAPVYITPAQLAERRAAEERRAAGMRSLIFMEILLQKPHYSIFPHRHSPPHSLWTLTRDGSFQCCLLGCSFASCPKCG